jgi:hypothetical protein
VETSTLAGKNLFLKGQATAFAAKDRVYLFILHVYSSSSQMKAEH